MKGDIRFGGEKKVHQSGFWRLWRRRARPFNVFDIAREQQQQSKKARTRKGEYTVLFVLLVMGALLYVSKQPFAQYQQVVVAGNKGVPQDAMMFFNPAW